MKLVDWNTKFRGKANLRLLISVILNNRKFSASNEVYQRHLSSCSTHNLYVISKCLRHLFCNFHPYIIVSAP